MGGPGLSGVSSNKALARHGTTPTRRHTLAPAPYELRPDSLCLSCKEYNWVSSFAIDSTKVTVEGNTFELPP